MVCESTALASQGVYSTQYNLQEWKNRGEFFEGPIIADTLRVP
jgi:hypothetical protein